MEQTTITPAKRTYVGQEITFKLAYSRTTSKGLLKNISSTGAFIQSEGLVAKLGKIVVTLIGYGNERDIAAEIVWTNEQGYGIKFIPRNKRDLRIIEDLVECSEKLKSERLNCLPKVFGAIS